MANFMRLSPTLMPCVLAACCLLAGCGMGGGDSMDGGASIEPCRVSAPTSCPSPGLRYNNDVKPIIDQRCTSCHSGQTEQWPLTDYAHVASWYDIIPAQLLSCQMPPPDAGIPITNAERMTILTWLHCGFAQ